jgi:hypothetical protein
MVYERPEWFLPYGGIGIDDDGYILAHVGCTS